MSIFPCQTWGHCPRQVHDLPPWGLPEAMGKRAEGGTCIHVTCTFGLNPRVISHSARSFPSSLPPSKKPAVTCRCACSRCRGRGEKERCMVRGLAQLQCPQGETHMTTVVREKSCTN